MNLRKIIREEVDEWDWVRDYLKGSDEIFFKENDRVLIRNTGEIEEFITWLGDYGDNYEMGSYGTEIIGTVIHDNSDNYPTPSFRIREERTGDRILFPYREYQNYLNEMDHDYGDLRIEYHLLSYETPINESEDDLDWIKKIEPKINTDIKWDVILRHPRTDSGWVGNDDPGPDNKVAKLYGWYLNSWKKSFNDWTKYNYDIKIDKIMGYIKPSIENRSCPRVGLDIFGEKNNQNYTIFIRNRGNCGYDYSVYYSPLTEKGKVVKQEDIIRTNEGHIQITKGENTLPDEILKVLRDN